MLQCRAAVSQLWHAGTRETVNSFGYKCDEKEYSHDRLHAFMGFSSILSVWCIGFYLCDCLPLRGIILTGMNTVVPAALHHIQHRLHGYVELGGPADLQLTGRVLQEHQLFPRLQRDS